MVTIDKAQKMLPQNFNGYFRFVAVVFLNPKREEKSGF